MEDKLTDEEIEQLRQVLEALTKEDLVKLNMHAVVELAKKRQIISHLEGELDAANEYFSKLNTPE